MAFFFLILYNIYGDIMDNQIIVVEGIHDQMRILSLFPNSHVVITHGREISKDTINMLKTLTQNNEIILFLDPDGPGEKIRNIITNEIPTAKQAFIPKKLCISTNKKKVGVEHASDNDIIEALRKVYTPKNVSANITINDLYEFGLIGNVNSLIIRNKISEELNIGAPNAKTFLKRINLFGITLDKLKELTNKYTI